ncbi:MAG: FeoB-associated Cys-rich membrane protein [Verrucomicrobia bacterium]|nr:FeoB-associated Cys-rich membrane protein [bacterium]NDA10455.1 FeoB-associated Cys-rich membrane protein [Verrucomicrobiota bacterium]NDA26491.1 FeoB-associated Cys-rich membrane protein [Verrucomicrobiota bacterium]NDD57144.1 FeoB-associated Cys-rich membrane protein [Verrucomicrobiota bacterium]NDD81840.1 FeoB-associated Cys-rich membrane protein [Verrucomicrobiota bacterium]
MGGGWQAWAVAAAVLAAAGYLAWKVFRKNREKGCGCGREGK